MDGCIQSCEKDEQLYHTSLVHPVLSKISAPSRVMIMGGGEGATAREVLSYSSVQQVDMYEWDQDVIDLFKTFYPQWGKGAWNDPRLHLYTEDVFSILDNVPDIKYDCIIIDLFDPSEDMMGQWGVLFDKITQWIHPRGSIVLYGGTSDKEEDSQRLLKLLESGSIQKGRIIHSYRVPIPSFLGDAIFYSILSEDK
jgi:spermidine synthase